jgi:hypothetical protein
LKLAQEVTQPIILRQRVVALGNRRVALRARRRNQRLQPVDIGRKLVCDVVYINYST